MWVYFCFTNADCEGDSAWGVEAAEWSESESNEVARLCIERDWVSFEFIRARRVTWSQSVRGKYREREMGYTFTRG